MPQTENRGHLRRLARTLAYRGEIVDLYKDTVQLPDGVIQEWDYVHHRKGGGACVVPVLPDGRILLVHQYRPAIGEETWELPAGAKDAPGEEPAVTALRELEEETGYTCSGLKFLARLKTAPAYCNEETFVFLGENIVRRGSQHPDEAEEIRLKAFPLEELLQAISSGTIQDAKTVAGILAYSTWKYLENNHNLL